MRRPALLTPVAVLFLAIAPVIQALAADTAPATSRGQLLYVPVYSKIPIGGQGHSALLAATLSIRNTDPSHAIEVHRADHYDAQGRRVAPYLIGPQRLDPLASVQIPLKETNEAGGPSSSFLVEWRSAEPVSPPIVETVMVGAVGTRGISFVGQARVLRNTPP